MIIAYQPGILNLVVSVWQPNAGSTTHLPLIMIIFIYFNENPILTRVNENFVFFENGNQNVQFACMSTIISMFLLEQVQHWIVENEQVGEVDLLTSTKRRN